MVGEEVGTPTATSSVTDEVYSGMKLAQLMMRTRSIRYNVDAGKEHINMRTV